tara:strand:+ start:999 stop:1790 length:792 start_codon:yes stop_codon:yes gene_type:complete
LIKISVICPTYNSNEYVERTIFSLINQTEKIDEIIISDDGSSDNTIEKIESFFKKLHSKFEYTIIRNKHAGPGAARNAGIKIAKHNWLGFIDSDDLWEHDKIEKIKNAILKNSNCNFVCHNEYLINSNHMRKEVYYSKKFDHNKNLVKQLYLSNKFSTSAVMCKKELFSNNKNFFDESLSSSQDYELWLRISPHLKVLFLDDILGSYVLRKGSITSGKITVRYLNEIKIAILHRHKVNIIYFLLKIILLSLKYFFYFIKKLFN